MSVAVFVVGGLDVHVQVSGERRFFLSAAHRDSGVPLQLGTARWEPGDRVFVLSLGGSDAYFPDGSELLATLVTKLDAVRSWHVEGIVPDAQLGILLGDNTASR